ncbi:hypothetical protein ACWDV4_10120 [Micromonospora sp. NPDC003197]
MLLAIGSVAQYGRVAKAASAAADRIAEAGISRPVWAAELNEPVTITDCRRLSDPQEAGAMLSGVFHRGGRSLAMLMSVDTPDCGAASQVLLIGADDLSEATQMMRDGLEQGGMSFVEVELDAAEFRWQVENAFEVRAAHDHELGSFSGVDFSEDEEILDYTILSVLVGGEVDPATGVQQACSAA